MPGMEGKIMAMDRKVLSWAFYDWANSAYATVVMAGFFPVFFKQYWAAGLSTGESTFALGVASLFYPKLPPNLRSRSCFLAVQLAAIGAALVSHALIWSSLIASRCSSVNG